MKCARSPEAAVFLRRLSWAVDVASSVPSGSCEVDAAGGASPVVCGAGWGRSGIGGVATEVVSGGQG